MTRARQFAANLPLSCRNLPQSAAFCWFSGKFAASLIFDTVQRMGSGLTEPEARDKPEGFQGWKGCWVLEFV